MGLKRSSVWTTDPWLCTAREDHLDVLGKYNIQNHMRQEEKTEYDHTRHLTTDMNQLRREHASRTGVCQNLHLGMFKHLLINYEARRTLL